MQNPLSIIIVHWNTPDLLKKQLSMLDDNKFEITVIDNLSDKPLSWINSDFPHVKLIQNKFNRGYAFACNQGALASRSEWLLFLNPDVETTSAQIEKMIVRAESSRFDACSPIPNSQNYKKPTPSAISLLAEFTPLKYLIPLSFFKQKTLTGGCLMIKSAVFKKLGGFDERFFLWFEDSDLTKRLIDNNFKVGWVDVAVNHKGGASFKYHDGQIHRDIFFHSMDVFAGKHFTRLEQEIVAMIKRRYSKRKLLPQINDGVSIAIPNVKENLLIAFLKNNLNTFNDADEQIIVSSSIAEPDIWSWRQQYPTVRFISLKKNNGFAQTANIGFRVSTTEWIATVNDDIILNNFWIRACLQCVNDPGSSKLLYGSINPVIYKTDGSIESAGVDVLKHGKALPREKIPSADCFIVDATNAAIVLYNRDALNKVGLFDEAFGSYLEDIDLSLRLKRAGFKNVVAKSAKVYHVGQATSSSLLSKTKPWLDFKNWILVIAKNWGLGKIIVNLPAIALERLRNFFGILKTLF